VFGCDYGEREMSGETEYPAWDGGPDRVLPQEASTDPLEFLQELLNSDLRPTASEDITDALKKGAIVSIAGGEVACPSLADRGMVILWLPFFEDQAMFGGADEPHVEHEEIEALERWRDTEAAMGALWLGQPTSPIELGFVVDERENFALPWFEYSRHYTLAPQYVVATWE
jgi:hypothetical protein